MAKAPEWKIYRKGEYIAACKFAADAAALVSVAGGVVKFRHSVIVWREGSEDFEAGESYDRAAAVMWDRKQAHLENQWLAVPHHERLPEDYDRAAIVAQATGVRLSG